MCIFLYNHFWLRKCCNSAVETFSCAQNNEPMKSCTVGFTLVGRLPGYSNSETCTKNTRTKRLSWHSVLLTFLCLYYSFSSNRFANEWLLWLPNTKSFLRQFYLMNRSKRLLDAWVYIKIGLMTNWLDLSSCIKLTGNVILTFFNLSSLTWPKGSVLNSYVYLLEWLFHWLKRPSSTLQYCNIDFAFELNQHWTELNWIMTP